MARATGARRAADVDREHVVRQPRPVRSHGVFARDGAQHDWVPVRAPVALNTDRPHVGKEHNGALPDLGIQPRRGQFLTGDGVGITQDFETVSGDLTHDTDAKTGPRKGLATDDDLGKPQLAADGAYLVFEEGAKGLDEVELEVFGQPTDVVVALDVGGSSPAAGLDHIRIEGALHEEPDGLAVSLGFIDEFALHPLERADELATDDLALLFGIADAGEGLEADGEVPIDAGLEGLVALEGGPASVDLAAAEGEARVSRAPAPAGPKFSARLAFR